MPGQEELVVKDINLDVEIIGALPPGRYDQCPVMNCQYLNDALAMWVNAAQVFSKTA